jgi:polyisoprenoid-binding protein YceI
MQINQLKGVALAGLMFTAFSCNNGVQSDQAEVSEARDAATISTSAARYQIDPAQSEMRWVGSKVTGRHPGTVDIKEGSIAVENEQIVGGRFVMDMNTVQARDEQMDEANNTKLTGHLKSEDFFQVEQYPDAVFEITGVEPIGTASVESNDTDTDYTQYRDYSEFRVMDPTHMITGNLTIRGETRGITFPAHVSMDNNEIKAKANFNIDRKEWNLTYGTDKSMGDKMLYSDFNLGFDIVARQ